MGELPTQAWEGSHNTIYLAVRLSKMHLTMRKEVSSTHPSVARRLTLGWGHAPNRRLCEAVKDSSFCTTDLHIQHLPSILPTVLSSWVPWLPVSHTAHSPSLPPGACPCLLLWSASGPLCTALPGSVS